MHPRGRRIEARATCFFCLEEIIIRRLIKTLVISLLLTGSVAWTGDTTMTFHYADGSAVQRQVQGITGDLALNAEIRGGGGPTVTLDTDVRLRNDTTFEEIFVVMPGQTILAGTFFNQLSTLEVPFTALVGRILIVAVFAPDVDIASIIQFTIEADDNNLIGISSSETIPVDAPAGPFFLFGLNRITGLTAANNTDSGGRVVQVPAGR